MVAINSALCEPPTSAWKPAGGDSSLNYGECERADAGRSAERSSHLKPKVEAFEPFVARFFHFEFATKQ
jgi:hypothetical protein